MSSRRVTARGLAASVLICAAASHAIGGRATAAPGGAPARMAALFRDPPQQYRSWPLYWLNGEIDPSALREQVEAMRDRCGFGGFAPLPMGSTRPAYLTDGYFARYGEMLELAERLGMKVILYDDIDFPGGTAGGRMAERFPDDLLKNLRKVEREVAGPARFEEPVPEGRLMAAVAMETTRRDRVDLAPFVKDGTLRWDAPAGTWKVMFFMCVRGHDRLVDYMDPDAVRRFVSLTYDEYFERFGKHFGKTVVMSFFDDLALCYTPGGRTWTPRFNERFAERHGRDPALLYPALWYDVGPDTAAARVAMLGMRAELMAEGYVRVVHEWCEERGIAISGHPAGNYNPQPVEVSGDNIKFYKHCDVPLLDSIHYYGHGRDGFKLPTSASFTYDRPLTAVEIYGNYPDASVDAAMLYRSAMELYVRGANLMIPHGMWYDPARMRIPPEISHRSARLGPELPACNRFVGRSSLLLQGGRHVADIGVLYPVAAMQAAYRFDVPGARQPNWGYDAPAEADYLAISGRLTGRVRRDFTFLHPEIVDERCRVEGAILRLENAANWEEYRVVVIPGGKVVPWRSLEKVRRFLDNGGRVVATTQLPFKSAEFGHDADVRRAVEGMFGVAPSDADAGAADEPCRVRIEASGSTIRTYVGGALVDVTVDGTFARGRVGFRESDNEQAGFANVKVTSPEGEVLFEDDFSRGLGRWTDTDGASVRDGWLTVRENQSMRSQGGAGWTDYAVEVDIKPDGEPAGVVFRAVDDGNYYMWQFWPSTNRLRPHRKVNGGWTVIKEIDCADADESPKPFRTRRHRGGGRAYFAPRPTAGTLKAILDDALPVADVAFEDPPRADSGKGMLSYIHKVKDGMHVYYFANSSDDRVDAWVRLRGRRALERWDPHSGSISRAELSHARRDGQAVTRVRLVLEPVRSVFLVAPQDEAEKRR